MQPSPSHGRRYRSSIYLYSISVLFPPPIAAVHSARPSSLFLFAPSLSSSTSSALPKPPTSSLPPTPADPASSCFHEPTEHRPILHLNLVNLPELANELWAWCLILAHEHGRRYTASNASGEGTCVRARVQSAVKLGVSRPGRVRVR